MKKINLWKLMDSPKFNCAFIIINLVLIVILGTRVVNIYNRVTEVQEHDEVVDTNKVENLSDLFVKADEEMIVLYTMVLENSNFELENGVSFRFYPDGKYEGYFDLETKDITGHYEIVADNDKNTLLLIFNNDKSKYVSYYISLEENGDIILKETISNNIFVLGF